MAWLFQLLLWSHILLGSMALFLFWVPVLTKKGGIDHRRFGHYFGKVMYAVALTGAVMGVLAILSPVGFKPQMFETSPSEELLYKVRLFWAFLVYLSLITFISVRQGMWALKISAPRQAATLSFMLPIYLCIAAGLMFITIGVIQKHPLYIPFGVLGLFIGFGVIRYCRRSVVTKREQIVEHLGGLIGSGIAAYTAFLSFGMRNLVPTDGFIQIASWIAPGVIGSIYIRYLSRQYNPKVAVKKG